MNNIDKFYCLLTFLNIVNGTYIASSENQEKKKNVASLTIIFSYLLFILYFEK